MDKQFELRSLKTIEDYRTSFEKEKIEDFSRFCVPAALTRVLNDIGIEATTLQVADMLFDWKGRGNACNTHLIFHAVREFLPDATLNNPCDMWREVLVSIYGEDARSFEWRDRKAWERPTLSNWLDYDGRYSIVIMRTHALVVKDGEVTEDNGYRPLRGKVGEVIYLDGASDLRDWNPYENREEAVERFRRRQQVAPYLNS